MCLVVLHSGCGSTTSQSRIDAITIEVTGSEFNWYFRYPGVDGVLGTEDDRYSVQDLYLPDNARIRLNLKSSDYVYNLAIPVLGEKEIAVPDLDFKMEFNTFGQDTWTLLGDQFCGYSHETLIGKVHVRDQAAGDFYEW